MTAALTMSLDTPQPSNIPTNFGVQKFISPQI